MLLILAGKPQIGRHWPHWIKFDVASGPQALIRFGVRSPLARERGLWWKKGQDRLAYPSVRVGKHHGVQSLIYVAV